MTEYSQHGAILPSSVCTAYCYWVLYSALSENPNLVCNSSGGKSDLRTIVGFILAAISVCYAAFNASQNTHSLSLTAKATSDEHEDTADDKAAPIKYHDAAEAEDAAIEKSEDEEVALKEQTSQAWRFQLMMASGACYACMLLTDWGEATDAKSNPGMTSVWIQIASQWLCCILYTWSLVAPYVCNNRDFA